MTTFELAVLSLAHGRDITQVADELEIPLSAVSRARNTLMAGGLIEPWQDYYDDMCITAAGRASLNADKSGGETCRHGVAKRDHCARCARENDYR